MINKIKKDKVLIAIILAFVILFSIVSYFILKSSQTKDAVVLKGNAASGTVVTPDMIAIIKVPINTPEGYLRNPQSVVGHKLRTNVKSKQFLYESNFMTSFSEMMDSDKIPDDYPVTSITMSNQNAVGGLITSGDYVDIMAVMDAGTNTETWTGIEATVDSLNGGGRTDSDKKVAYILSNVYILSKDNDVGEGVRKGDKEATSGSSTYAVALSYDDLKKLRQVEGMKDIDLWMNITPAQNQKEGQKPLLKQMVGQSYSFLHDAQEPVQDRDGNLLMDKYYIEGAGGFSEKSIREDEVLQNKKIEEDEETKEETKEESEDIE